MKNIVKGTVQVAALMIFTLLMNKLAELLHLPVPGSILGIIVLFILLETGIIRLEWIDLGASWLLAELLLFFVPAAVGVMKYIPMLKSDGVRILIVVIFSTFIVMASSGLLAAWIAKQKERRASQ
ncbi:CidA/LrgA family holin-like protein [Paenibacillus sp. KQZ6P-2]|uniref:CidA/LrgA family holin-like protein n=1 Tax=Paenibacillus mangrovi TaxID=2931978 RepID=A0A9X1WSS3_9BACL|nr:CidA/LrgA family holin-like protein [Paenibacillus mangrovi]MCJ8012860.1 CidA/LrgA family holin-like protein [Paenibacillus mangrovi]